MLSQISGVRFPMLRWDLLNHKEPRKTLGCINFGGGGVSKLTSMHDYSAVRILELRIVRDYSGAIYKFKHATLRHMRLRTVAA